MFVVGSAGTVPLAVWVGQGGMAQDGFPPRSPAPHLSRAPAGGRSQRAAATSRARAQGAVTAQPLLSHHTVCHACFNCIICSFFSFLNLCISRLVLSFHFSAVLPSFQILFCFVFFFTHSRLSPLSGFSISQTPHHFSRCYDKPWLINSKAGTPLRGFDYSDFQLSSSEVEYGLVAPRTCRQAGVRLTEKSCFLACLTLSFW